MDRAGPVRAVGLKKTGLGGPPRESGARGVEVEVVGIGTLEDAWEGRLDLGDRSFTACREAARKLAGEPPLLTEGVLHIGPDDSRHRRE